MCVDMHILLSMLHTHLYYCSHDCAMTLGGDLDAGHMRMPPGSSRLSLTSFLPSGILYCQQVGLYYLCHLEFIDDVCEKECWSLCFS